MYNPYSLKGKTILITGASSGIGRTTAIECSRLGAKVILSGRNLTSLEETLSQLDGEIHQILTADLTDDKQRAELIDDISILDGCVLNAGLSKLALIPYYKEEDLKDLFEINTFSPILLTRQLVKKKKLKNPSSIVYTASIAGYSNIVPSNGMYGASKAALSAYMKYAALELSGKGIRCNAVHPGMTNTSMIKNRHISEEDLKKDTENYPLRRYGNPEEIAWAIIYLLSDASAWVTGTDLVIDGGRSLK